MKKIVIFLVTMVLLVGCFGEKEKIETKIVGNTYALQGVIPESEIDITFEKEKVVGVSSVNRYFGNYKLNGDKISIQEIGSTRMMGPENLMIQEQEYLKNLKEAKNIEVTKDGVIITTESGEKLRFVKK